MEPWWGVVGCGGVWCGGGEASSSATPGNADLELQHAGGQRPERAKHPRLPGQFIGRARYEAAASAAVQAMPLQAPSASKGTAALNRAPSRTAATHPSTNSPAQIRPDSEPNGLTDSSRGLPRLAAPSENDSSTPARQRRATKGSECPPPRPIHWPCPLISRRFSGGTPTAISPQPVSNGL